ncbi:hypothetical protein GCM10027256_38660 [Novispirillum itersonii subsp. nipponicum]
MGHRYQFLKKADVWGAGDALPPKIRDYWSVKKIHFLIKYTDQLWAVSREGFRLRTARWA